MSEPETVNRNGKTFDLHVTNVAAAKELRREFVALENSRLANVAETVRLATRANEQAASFYERLMLLDGGTIALSLTLIGYLITRGAPANFPRGLFVGLVCPAWLLLLISIWVSLTRIVNLSHVNGSLIRQWSALTGHHYKRNFGNLMQKASVFVEGEITSEEGKIDASQLFKEVSNIAGQSAKEHFETSSSLVEKGTENSPESLLAARIPAWSTLAAFVLLCAFTITALMAR